MGEAPVERAEALAEAEEPLVVVEVPAQVGVGAVGAQRRRVAVEEQPAPRGELALLELGDVHGARGEAQPPGAVVHPHAQRRLGDLGAQPAALEHAAVQPRLGRRRGRRDEHVARAVGQGRAARGVAQAQHPLGHHVEAQERGRPRLGVVEDRLGLRAVPVAHLGAQAAGGAAQRHAAVGAPLDRLEALDEVERPQAT